MSTEPAPMPPTLAAISSAMSVFAVVSAIVWGGSTFFSSLAQYKGVASYALLGAIVGLQLTGMFSATGAMEVFVNGKKVHSKIETREYPDLNRIISIVREADKIDSDDKGR